jgi:hypothetical protein
MLKSAMMISTIVLKANPAAATHGGSNIGPLPNNTFINVLNPASGLMPS